MVKEQLVQLPVNRIKTQRNVRKSFDEQETDRLLRSMREHGLLEPIRVQPAGESYIVITGETRLRCAQSLGWETIPAIVVSEPLTEAAVVEQQLVENMARTDLCPIDKAQGIRDLISLTKYNASQAAARLAISNAEVTRLLALLTLPAAIQDMIRSSSISPSVGYELSRIADPAQQLAAAQQAMSGKLTRDELAGKRKAAARTTEARPSKSINRVTAVLCGHKSVTVAGQSLTLDEFIAAIEDCLGKARQCRTKGLSLSTFARMCKETAHAS